MATTLTWQVNYVAKGCSVYNAGEEPSMANWVVARHLGNSFLWDQVAPSACACATRATVMCRA